MKISIVRNILEANESAAKENREHLDRARVLAVNITSAPGSGKTSLLEATVPGLGAERRCAVIVGDLQTTRDAERIGVLGVEIVQINTEGGCHLTASQVSAALDRLDLDGLSFIFIENIGNMVCPAAFDLGEHARVAMLSVPEGDDKVAKYPTLFQPADAILLNKADLVGVLDYDMNRVRDDLNRINTRAPFIEMSVKTGRGIEEWLAWLRGLQT